MPCPQGHIATYTSGDICVSGRVSDSPSCRSCLTSSMRRFNASTSAAVKYASSLGRPSMGLPWKDGDVDVGGHCSAANHQTTSIAWKNQCELFGRNQQRVLVIWVQQDFYYGTVLQLLLGFRRIDQTFQSRFVFNVDVPGILYKSDIQRHPFHTHFEPAFVRLLLML